MSDICSIQSGDNLTVILQEDSGQPKVFNISRYNTNFNRWVRAVEENDADFFKSDNQSSKIQSLKADLESYEGFTFDEDNLQLFYKNELVNNSIAKRIVEYAKSGKSNYKWLQNFFVRLSRNPSYRSREMLFDFLNAMDIAINPQGMIIGYKAVRSNYMDKYSGSINNAPGEVVSMPRHKVSDDPNDTCSQGLHTGSLSYSGPDGWYTGANDKIVVLEIDPEDVVCVPNDHNMSKMRVCRYKVVKDYVNPYHAIAE